MKKYTLMLDTSGSTHSQTYYSRVKRVIEPFTENITKSYFWNNTCDEKDVEILKKSDKELKDYADGGTEPISCLQVMKENNILENIIFITDGEISVDEVKKMDDFITKNDMVIKNIECFVITDSAVNDSVLIPLLRSNENCKLTRVTAFGENLVMNIKNDLLKQIENMTLEEFLEKKEDIKQCIINKKIGSLNKIDVSKFITLRDKYKSEIRKTINLTRDLEIEKEFIKNAVDNFEKFQDSILIKNVDDLDTIEKEISKIINLCNLDLNDKLRYNENFNLLASHEADHNDEIVDTKVDLNLKFECPIYYDDDTVVLTFNSEIEFDKSYLTNPLGLINNKEFVTNLKKSIMRPLGLKAFNKLYEKTDPFSRQEIIGFITLSNNPEHVRISQNMICKVFFQGKFYKNFQLLFYVIWYLLPKIEFLNEIQPVYDKFIKDYTFKVWPGLINSNYYKEKIDLKTAFLFIVTSFKNIQYNKGNIINDSKIGCFQQFFSCIKLMISYLKLCSINLDQIAIENASEALSLFFKKNDDRLLTLLKTAYQNSIRIDNQIILIDGPGNEEQAFKEIKEKYSIKMLENDEILNIVGFEKFEYAVNWPNYCNSEFKSKKLEICSNTCRPYYFTNLRPVRTWKDEAKECFGEKFVSITKQILEYIVEFEVIPEQNDMLIFLAKKYKAYENSHFTLPSCIISITQSAMLDYKDIFKTIHVKEIKKRYLDSVRCVDRISMQQYYPADYLNYLPTISQHKNIDVHYKPRINQFD